MPNPNYMRFQASLHLASFTLTLSVFHAPELQDTVGELEPQSTHCESGRWEDQPPSIIPL